MCVVTMYLLLEDSLNTRKWLYIISVMQCAWLGGCCPATLGRGVAWQGVVKKKKKGGKKEG